MRLHSVKCIAYNDVVIILEIMKYYIIAGEASGDLHASHLMRALKKKDSDADFRFFGGDMMSAAGGTRVRHYRELAYMGFVPVLLHLRTIFRNMAMCKSDIMEWKPDVVILVDYPGFNLSIARFVRAKTDIPVFYYISPKIWAWKEYRIKNIKRDVTEMFSILPFEKDFYEKKHSFPINYVGNPTSDEVALFRSSYNETFGQFAERTASQSQNAASSAGCDGLDTSLPVIALLAGSRKQEIKDNLPDMIKAALHFADKYQLILAGAPGIPHEYYAKFLAGTPVKTVYGETYPLLSHATAALVTSGTATLETALFGVPQVVCYETPIPKVISFLRRHLIKVKYISLVNLIAGREVVPELVADTFTTDNIREHLGRILPGGPARDAMTEGYKDVMGKLGNTRTADNAARLMIEKLKKYHQHHAV